MRSWHFLVGWLLIGGTLFLVGLIAWEERELPLFVRLCGLFVFTGLARIAVVAFVRRFALEPLARALGWAGTAMLFAALAVLWTRFWRADLHEARLAWTLLTVPAGALALPIALSVDARLPSLAARSTWWAAAPIALPLAPLVAMDVWFRARCVGRFGVAPCLPDRWDLLWWYPPVVVAAVIAVLAIGRPPARVPEAPPRLVLRRAIAGAIVGLAWAWPWFAGRSVGVGCVGVSRIFDATVWSTGVALYAAGPWAISALLDE